MKPIVAIVGRPNVGKSRLFNRIVGYRKALVDDTPGLTRDRHYALANWNGREFIVVDTGGIDFDKDIADIEKKVTKQSLEAISEADLVLCLFDGFSEITPHDKDLASRLRKINKPVIFAVNKIDDAARDASINSFYELGVDNLILCSAEHGRNIGDLLDKIVAALPETEAEKEGDALRVTVVGRPNVGKSTLINRLCGEDRVVAHETAGTTRDAIDVKINFEGKNYIFVDTAGVRRHFKMNEKVERISAIKSIRAIDRCDLVCLLVDAEQGITHQDLSLAGFVNDEGKGLLILFNKWDQVDKSWEEYSREQRYRLKDLSEAIFFQISAKTGFNCLKIFSGLTKLDNALNFSISTSKLNKILERIIASHHLPVHRGKLITINYATQVGQRPPSFILFSNDPKGIPESYKRYISGKIKESLGLEGIPLKLIFRKKS